MVFSTFFMDQFGKIRRHHWKERLKISKIAKFESDASLASEGIVAIYSSAKLRKFTDAGAHLMGSWQTLQKSVKFRGFEELYLH